MPDSIESLHSVRTVGASISAFESLINALTQTFRIGTRDINSYHDSGSRFPRRHDLKLPGMQLAAVDLTGGGGGHVREKSRMVHKALSFVTDILRQQPLLPNRTIPLGQARVPVEKRLLGKALSMWAAERSTLVNNVKIQHGDVRRRAMALKGQFYRYIMDLDHASACCQRQSSCRTPVEEVVAQNRDLVGNDSDCKTRKPSRYSRTHAVRLSRQSTFAKYNHRNVTGYKCQKPSRKTRSSSIPNSSTHCNAFRFQGQGRLERSDKAVSYKRLRGLEDEV
ncbi:hypothetical protein BDR22DRAFT_967506 [Usnea florida]